MRARTRRVVRKHQNLVERGELFHRQRQRAAGDAQAARERHEGGVRLAVARRVEQCLRGEARRRLAEDGRQRRKEHQRREAHLERVELGQLEPMLRARGPGRHHPAQGAEAPPRGRELRREPAVLGRVQRRRGAAGGEALAHADPARQRGVPALAAPSLHRRAHRRVGALHLPGAARCGPALQAAQGVVGDVAQGALQGVDDGAQEDGPLQLGGAAPGRRHARLARRGQVHEAEGGRDLLQVGEDALVVARVVELGGEDLDLDRRLGNPVDGEREGAAADVPAEVDDAVEHATALLVAQGRLELRIFVAQGDAPAVRGAHVDLVIGLLEEDRPVEQGRVGSDLGRHAGAEGLGPQDEALPERRHAEEAHPPHGGSAPRGAHGAPRQRGSAGGEDEEPLHVVTPRTRCSPR